MKKHTLTLLLALALPAILVGCGKRSVDEGTVVSVIYSSDTRGRLEGCGCKHNGGGITRRAARIEVARSEDETVMYLDAGNFLSGTDDADKSRGQAIVAAYNELGTTAVNVSERELSFGMDAFREAKESSKFPYLSANIRVNGGAIADPFVMKRVKGANVAIVGLCGTRAVMRYDSTKLPPGVEILDPLIAARQVIPPLEGKADLIVVLSTCGDATDSLLAQNFQMIELIIGGRSYRPNSDSPWVLGNARIVRTERDGRNLGRLDMVFGPERKIKTFSPSTLAMETSDPSSQKMLAVVRQYLPAFTDNPTDGKPGTGGQNAKPIQ